MKNLLGKFHAESMPVLGLAQQVFPYKKSGTCSMVRICCHNTYNNFFIISSFLILYTKNFKFFFFNSSKSQCNFFKWDGKETKILHLLFHRIWKSNYNQVLNSVFCRGKNLINSNSLPLWHAPILGLNNFYSYRDHSHFCTNSYWWV